MSQIWKYELNVNAPGGVQTLNMPRCAQVLTVAVQRGVPMLWAVVDPGAKPEPRKFYIVPTGEDFVPNNGRYIGTVQMLQERFVVHVFEAV